MAHFRQRANGVEVTIKRAGVLAKPLIFNVLTMEEAQDRAARLEEQIDRGILPQAALKSRPVKTIDDLVDEYTRNAHPSRKDQQCLGVICKTHGKTHLDAIQTAWVDDWISSMKRAEQLKPSSVRARVGALARCTDWGMRKKYLLMPDHPLRTLPDGYSQYNKADVKVVGEVIADESRDRRLEPGEFERILAVIEAGMLPRRQRPLMFEHREAIKCLFLLALETGMRLREMYTLTVDQVDLTKRTIFLDKTKNGDKRQVPLSSVALKLMTEYLATLQTGKPVTKGRTRGDIKEPPATATVKTTNLVFPWWNGLNNPRSLGLASDYLSRLYRGIFEAAGAKSLKFHDLRHEAISRLFERTSLSETAIMKISGHKSHKMIMRYANLRGSNLADSLW